MDRERRDRYVLRQPRACEAPPHTCSSPPLPRPPPPAHPHPRPPPVRPPVPQGPPAPLCAALVPHSADIKNLHPRKTAEHARLSRKASEAGVWRGRLPARSPPACHV
ncbi:unnamed protein product [Colias eurytheme]|nr:unnamed protein product [Colias eurytheme]